MQENSTKINPRELLLHASRLEHLIERKLFSLVEVEVEAEEISHVERQRRLA